MRGRTGRDTEAPPPETATREGAPARVITSTTTVEMLEVDIWGPEPAATQGGLT